jgi:hypothetical protein
VSSTLGELAEERRAVSRAISALRLTPVLFELGARPPQRGEADLATQIRQVLGADRFDQVYADGARLSRREAVAAVRDQRTGTHGVPEAGRRSARCRNHAGRPRV